MQLRVTPSPSPSPHTSHSASPVPTRLLYRPPSQARACLQSPVPLWLVWPLCIRASCSGTVEGYAHTSAAAPSRPSPNRHSPLSLHPSSYSRRRTGRPPRRATAARMAQSSHPSPATRGLIGTTPISAGGWRYCTTAPSHACPCRHSTECPTRSPPLRPPPQQ